MSQFGGNCTHCYSCGLGLLVYASKWNASTYDKVGQVENASNKHYFAKPNPLVLHFVLRGYPEIFSSKNMETYEFHDKFEWKKDPEKVALVNPFRPPSIKRYRPILSYNDT